LRTRRRGSDLRAFAAAAPRFAVSLSAASLASRSARRRAVFAASACREGVLALVSELTFSVVLNCSSARRRLASPGRGWERIGAASLYRWTISPGSTCFPEYHWKRGDTRP